MEKYIRACVTSIMGQTFQNFELIVVDDCTPDRSMDICKEICGDDARVKFLRQKKNSGLGASRNVGLKVACGKYVYFVDSDDVLLPETLETFYNVAEKTGADVVQTSRWLEHRSEEDPPQDREKFVKAAQPYTQEGYLPENPLLRLKMRVVDKALWPMVWLTFVRRDLLKRNKITFENVISEDEIYSADILSLAERVFVLNAPLYIYRRRGKSIITERDFTQYSRWLQLAVVSTRHMEELLKRLPPTSPEILNLLKSALEFEFLNRAIPFYDSGSISPELDAAAEKAFAPFFGKDSSFVRYLMHKMAAAELRAEFLQNKLNERAT